MASVGLLCGALREFLRYAHRQGVLVGDVSKTVDRPRTYRLSEIPRSISPAEVSQVLACVDRSSTRGMRDYAAVLLLATYGLRSREIAALTLDHIDWRRERLSVPARKGAHSPISTCAVMSPSTPQPDPRPWHYSSRPGAVNQPDQPGRARTQPLGLVAHRRQPPRPRDLPPRQPPNRARRGLRHARRARRAHRLPPRLRLGPRDRAQRRRLRNRSHLRPRIRARHRLRRPPRIQSARESRRREGLSKQRAREYLPYRMLEVEVAANAVYSWAAHEILARRLEE
jgi:integrase